MRANTPNPAKRSLFKIPEESADISEESFDISASARVCSIFSAICTLLFLHNFFKYLTSCFSVIFLVMILFISSFSFFSFCAMKRYLFLLCNRRFFIFSIVKLFIVDSGIDETQVWLFSRMLSS